MPSSLSISAAVSPDFAYLIGLALFLSVLGLILSLVALRVASRKNKIPDQTPAAVPSAEHQQAAKTGTPAPAVTDPALIAVLTAAVSMMLGEKPAQRQTPRSKAGFTIRKVRRV